MLLKNSKSKQKMYLYVIQSHLVYIIDFISTLNITLSPNLISTLSLGYLILSYHKPSHKVTIVHPSVRTTGTLQIVGMNQLSFNEFRILVHGNLSQWSREYLLVTHGTKCEVFREV
jgi:hypothetical protein